jgi:hypothetical protein
VVSRRDINVKDFTCSNHILEWLYAVGIYDHFQINAIIEHCDRFFRRYDNVPVPAVVMSLQLEDDHRWTLQLSVKVVINDAVSIKCTKCSDEL